jgi:hypothetical protein
VYEKHLEIFQPGQTESDCRTFMDPGGQVSYKKSDILFTVPYGPSLIRVRERKNIGGVD